MNRKNSDISIEAFRKRAGSKWYRTVRIRVSGALVEIGDFCVESDEEAMEKAEKALNKALEIVNNERQS